VWVYPGNPGMKITPKVWPMGGEVNFERALSIVRELKIDFVVIGPEKFLFEAFVDRFKQARVPVFGPTRAASFLEESKIRSKIFMKEFGIPTADFGHVGSFLEACSWIESHPAWTGYVLKLSGPALGKGVVVTRDAGAAKAASREFFDQRPPGIEDGLVIEEAIDGKEVSLFYACEESCFKFIASACDHKRLLDHDLGPNTGGMGAYSPCHWIDDRFLELVEEKIVKPTLAGMLKRGTPFSGMLFLGLMVNERGFYLLEYNTRFGDPETQAFLPVFEGNLTEILYSASTGKPFPKENQTQKKTALHVVKAAKGYPGLNGQAVQAGQAIMGDAPHLSKALLFYAGVKEENGILVSNGGRVLGFTGLGASLSEARVHAYESLSRVCFSGEQFRSDIGEVK